MAKGKKTGGRRKGVPNKITGEFRANFKKMFDGLSGDVENWIRAEALKNPGEAASLVLRLAEFHIPKLQRLTVDITKLSIEEIAAELARREAEGAVT